MYISGKKCFNGTFSQFRTPGFKHLDGRNRAIIIAESLARVVAAIRITSVRWRSYLSPKHIDFGPRRLCIRCAAIRIARLAFVGVVFVPRGSAEWLARVDSVC